MSEREAAAIEQDYIVRGARTRHGPASSRPPGRDYLVFLKERPRCLLKGQSAIVEITPSPTMPLETFDGCKALARVAVLDGGKTVAVGKVLKILNKAT